MIDRTLAQRILHNAWPIGNTAAMPGERDMGVCYRKVATTHRYNNNVRNKRARSYSDLFMMQNQKLSQVLCTS